MTCSIARPALSPASREALELLELACSEIVDAERRRLEGDLEDEVTYGV
jgi:hypothetical protein